MLRLIDQEDQTPEIPAPQAFNTSAMEVDMGDQAGLRPLPMQRMFQQAGRPMSPGRRAQPSGPGYMPLDKDQIKVNPALHELTIKRVERNQRAIETWDPIQAESKQRLNNTNPAPRSRTVAPSEDTLRESLQPMLRRWNLEARKAGAFSVDPKGTTLGNKYDMTMFVDDKQRNAIKDQVFRILGEKVGGSRDAKANDLPMVVRTDLQRLGNDLLYEWNARRSNQRREHSLDMLEIRRDTIKPI